MITLKQFITEEDYGNNFDEFLRALKMDCQPFLKINEHSLKRGNFIWRGFTNAESVNFFSRYPRSNRRPLSTNKRIHQVFDNFFEKEFGFKYRSGAVFGSQDRSDANSYSFHGTYAIFPSLNYTLLASNKVTDLFAQSWPDDVDDILRNIFSSDSYEVTDEEEQLWHDSLRTMNYFETMKIEDIVKTREIMIKCHSYFAIRLSEDGMFRQNGIHHESSAPIKFVDLLYNEK